MRVPVYEQQVRTEDTVNFGGAIKTDAKAGTQTLDVVARQAEVYNKIFQEQKRKTDEIRATEAAAKLTEQETRILTAATNKRGKDAIGIYDTALTDFEKQIKEVEKDLTPDQVNLFRVQAQQKMLSADRTLQNHIANETVRYDTETTTAYIKNERDAGIANYKDMARTQESLNNQLAAAEGYAARNGMSDEELELRKGQIMNEHHSSIISRMLSSDYEDGAEQYFEAVKDQLRGEQLLKVEEAIKSGTTSKKAQGYVDSFIKSGMSESAAYAKAREIDEIGVRDEVNKRIAMDYGRRESARRDGLEKAEIALLNIFEQGGDPRKNPMWRSLDTSRRNAIEKRMIDISSGKNAVSDPVLYSDLMTMASNPKSREDFNKYDLYSVINKLNKNDFSRLKKIQDEFRKGDESKSSTSMSVKSYAENTLSSLGIRDKEEKAGYLLKLDNIIENEEKVAGKSYTKEEYKKRVDELFIQEIDTGFFGKNKRIIDLDLEDIDNVKYKEIPERKRSELYKKIQKRGLNPTFDLILNEFKNELRRSRGADEK